ncbi:MAG: hypothetical protein M3Q61_03785, partial [Chloroflexota bacterium]|nr:hypothetical protein [Chloroflexota bacterium]
MGRGSLVRSIILMFAAAMLAVSGLGATASAATISTGSAAPLSVLGATYAATVPATAGAGTTIQIPVTVTNTGNEIWNTAGANIVNLSYHWYSNSAVTVWDGLRTALPAPVVPGGSVTVSAVGRVPPSGGALQLRFHLVKEGLAWFPQPSQAYALSVPVAVWAGRYDAPLTSAAGQGETRTIPVTVANTGNVAWSSSGANPVNLGYHLFDSAGRTVVWDGTRTPLGADLPAGQSRVLNVTYTAPSALGTYSLNVEAVREGITWFSGYGVPAASSRLTVASGYSAGYGVTTTPTQVSIGAALDLNVDVTNYGPRTLTRGVVSLSYHLHTAGGATVVWDGARGVLPRDIAPGQTLTVPIRVQFPASAGDYRLSWDLVQEGVAWLSQVGVPMKVEPVSVLAGVTFYGKGFGHGVGMSQFGAQALATGAGGVAPKTGEQIIQHYYRGTQITPINTSGENAGIRVLLSLPSSTGIYSCGSPAMNVSLANVSGWGAGRILNEGAGNALIATAASREPFQIHATGGLVRVWRNAGTPVKVYEGPGPVVFVADPAGSLEIAEKGTYRGNTRFTNAGGVLRVVNYVNYDHYAMGVIRKEMFGGWHHEAYKAQAYAAKAYGFTSYRGSGSDYDVRDDQLDQCYGGVGAEEGPSNLAVEATRGKIPTYNGQVIRAYFSSSSGGYTVADG